MREAHRGSGPASGGPPHDALRALLADLHRALRARPEPAGTPADLRAVARQVGPEADLAARFAAQAAEAGATVHRCTAGRLDAQVAALLAAAGARRVIVAGAAGQWLDPSRAATLAAALRTAGLEVRHAGELRFGEADAAVTGVDAAVAETGSLVLSTAGGLPRGLTLLPAVHVAVVGCAQIVPDLCDLMDRLAQRELPSCVVLATGPSKTADIEGVLVTGVHGPGRVAVVLVEADGAD